MTITYAVTTGTLPAGLTMTMSGLITGTPTNAGNIAFTVSAINAGGTTAQYFTGTIASNLPVWTTAAALGSYVAGTAITAIQLVATGATNYLITTGSLPTGLSMTSAGLITGTPTTASSIAFSVTASGTGGSAIRAFTGTITPAPIPMYRMHTNGANIVNSTGATVALKGCNVFGTESSNVVIHGLWAVSYKAMLEQIAGFGMNFIRIPLSAEMNITTATSSINLSVNPDLTGSAMDTLGKIIDYAATVGIYVMLDCHRLTFGAGTDSALSSSTVSTYVTFWQLMATTYGSKVNIIGADLANENYTTDWPTLSGLYTIMGNAIQAIQPLWLIICEGTGTYNSSSYWWGGNLQGVATTPVSLNVANRLVYSFHDYGLSVSTQPWLESTTNTVSGWPGNLSAVFDLNWGYITSVPLICGEFGGQLGFNTNTGAVDSSQVNAAYEVQWIQALLTYMQAKGVSWTYWAYQPLSSDTGGLIDSDFLTPQTGKLAILDPYLP